MTRPTPIRPLPIRVVVVDDHELLRRSFATILEAGGDITVVSEAADGGAGIAAVEAHRPDVVLMDIRMPGVDGLTATARITASHPATRVLVLTTFGLDDYVVDALRAGASGFLLKSVSPEDLVGAVHAVVDGDAVLAPAVTRTVIDLARRRDRAGDHDPLLVDALTARERDVLGLICRGRANAEIADELDMAEATAKTHVSSVLAKLGVRDRVQAVIWAYESGAVDDLR